MPYPLRISNCFVGLVCALLVACAAKPEALPVESGDLHLLASVRITASAGAAPIQKTSGFLFYVRTLPSSAAGPALEGYELRDGRVVDTFGGDSDSVVFIDAIKKIDLRPFDYDREVERVETLVSAQAAARAAVDGREVLVTGARDGAEWEIQIVTVRGKFSLRAWNPGSTIDAYAEHSEDIRRLKATIDLMAQYYGRSKFGF